MATITTPGQLRSIAAISAAGVNDVLAVVEEQQEVPPTEVVDEFVAHGASAPVGQADGGSHDVDDIGWCRRTGEVGDCKAAFERPRQARRELLGEPRLARSARSGDGDQSARGQQVSEPPKLVAAPDKGTERRM